jgi:diadenosine tetraphosphate (Ap4A) HIT family hydrolase
MGRVWPADWEDRLAGKDCDMCAQGRPDETPWGIRVCQGRASDAYLSKHGPQRGYVYVVWRGRHVAEPYELVPEEAGAYWYDLSLVAHRMKQYFGATKINYLVAGNQLPHLHTHLISRYVDDPAPGTMLPTELYETPRPVEELHADAGGLRALLAGG